MSSFTRRTTTYVVSSLAVTTVGLGMMTALAADASPDIATTSSILAAARAAIAKQHGLHLVVSARSGSSSGTEKVIVDLGTKAGTASISTGKATVRIKVTSTYGYFAGNSSGLTTIFGLSSAEAKKVGKDWVSVKAGTTPYTDFHSEVTISSVTDVLPEAKGTTLSTESAGGTKLYVLKWTTAATSSEPTVSNTLTLSALGATLPVEETGTASGGFKETTMFSEWGEHILVSAPPTASTVAYSKITG